MQMRQAVGVACAMAHGRWAPHDPLCREQFRSLSIGRRQAELTARSALEMAEAELEAWIGACTRAAAKWMEG